MPDAAGCSGEGEKIKVKDLTEQVNTWFNSCNAFPVPLRTPEGSGLFCYVHVCDLCVCMLCSGGRGQAGGSP